MEVLLSLLLGLFLLVTVIITWRNRNAILALEDEQKRLRQQVRKLTAHTGLAEASSATVAAATPPPQAETTTEPDWGDLPLTSATQTVAPENSAAEPTFAPSPTKEKLSFEQQFGARLPVWIGGLALILAGFFLVKYSIEMGLLSPAVRVVLGLFFGGGLLATAHWVRHHKVAGGRRIAQALSGAGIADLYICLFAAYTLYDLIPAWLGFTGMALVTIGAVFLALEQGLPIAVLGLVGGFATPALISTGHPSALLLFSYLYSLSAGFIFVIRQRDWWHLAIPTLSGAFLWVLLWLFGGYFAPADTIWLGLFLLALSATIIAAQHQNLAQAMQEQPLLTLGKTAIALHFGVMGGAVLLMSLLAAHAGFNNLEWGLFGLLTTGGIALAYFNQRLYGLVPWFSLAANSIMLLCWQTPDALRYGLTLSIFAALYVASGYALQARSARPLLWSGLVTASSFIFYLIAYNQLHLVPELQSIPLFWGSLALGLAFAAVEMLRRLVQQIPLQHEQRAAILSLYAATATGFVALGLTIELEREFLSVAFAFEMLALCWLHHRFALPALRTLAAVLAVGFGCLLLPQIMLLIQLTAYSLVEAQLALQQTVPLVQWPLFQLGLPALCFAAGSLLLRRKQDDRIVRGFEIAAIALVGVMGYYLARHALHPDDNILFVKAGFSERGVITTFLFLYGLGCVALGRRTGRSSIGTSGFVLVAMALFRVLFFDCLRYNPLWAMQNVGAWPLLNALLLPYALPIVWLALLMRQMPTDIYLRQARPWLRGLRLALAFTWLSLTVRQLYHGAFLSVGDTSNAEIYSYSAAWLVLGIVLLGLGTLRQEKMLRIASLFIMIATVGKVFLYDAAALSGLYRVFSFFGLGISLMALSWFYARFIFRNRTEL